MPRAARVVAEGVPHHITQRGNNRQDVFLVDEDRRFYLETLAQDCRRCGVGVSGYCLMTNHVHLVAVPERADSFARALRRSHSRYAQRFNRQYGRSGHLWQNRFFSSPLGRDHLLTALFYVDQNPLRAGSVGQAEHYPWSNAQAHAEERDPAGLIDWALWRQIPGKPRWDEALTRSPAADDEKRVREATYAGMPLGNREFVAGLEQRFGRRLTLRSPGPQPKTKAASP